MDCAKLDGRWEIMSCWMRNRFEVTLVAYDFIEQIRKEIGKNHKFEMKTFVRCQELLCKSVDIP